MRYENLIWDFDGTLFDTYPPMCRQLREAMASIGHAFTEEELMAQFTVSRGTVLRYCGERTGMTAEAVDTVYRAWVADHGQPEAHPFPHVVEVLERFRTAGGRHFIFTHRSGSVHDFLAKAGLAGYFTEVTSAGTVYARKPDPAGNLYLISHNGLDTARTLAVGDRELDILAAKNAGIDACLFTKTGTESAADYQIGSFAELPALLGLE